MQPKAAIRSYVLRNSRRMTSAQQRALQNDWYHYGIDVPAGYLNLSEIFGNEAPIVLEIGSGKGDLITQMAAADPTRNFLSVEVYRPGVGAILRKARNLSIDNLRVVCDDVVSLLHSHIADDTFDQVMILFPDPWQKKRHHKRRLIQTSFVVLLADKMKQGGFIYLATDWMHYAAAMRRAIEGSCRYRRCDSVELARPQTVFEKRARRSGRYIFNLTYQVI